MSYEVFINKKRTRCVAGAGGAKKDEIVKEIKRRNRLGRDLKFKESWTKSQLCEVLADDDQIIETMSIEEQKEYFGTSSTKVPEKKEEKKRVIPASPRQKPPVSPKEKESPREVKRVSKLPQFDFPIDLKQSLQGKLDLPLDSILTRYNAGQYAVWDIDTKKKVREFHDDKWFRYSRVAFEVISPTLVLEVNAIPGRSMFGGPDPDQSGRIAILNTETKKLVYKTDGWYRKEGESVNPGELHGALLLSYESGEVFFYTSAGEYIWNFLEDKVTVVSRKGGFRYAYKNTYIKHPENPRILLSSYYSEKQTLRITDLDAKRVMKGKQTVDISYAKETKVEVFRLFPISNTEILGVGSGIVLFDINKDAPYDFKTTELVGHWQNRLSDFKFEQPDHRYYFNKVAKLTNDLYAISSEFRDTFYIFQLSTKALALFIIKPSSEPFVIRGLGDTADNLMAHIPERKMLAVIGANEPMKIRLIGYSKLNVTKSFYDQRYNAHDQEFLGIIEVSSSVNQMEPFYGRSETYIRAVKAIIDYMTKANYVSKNLAGVIGKFL